MRIKLNNINYTPASKIDELFIKSLLIRCNLPYKDIMPRSLKNFIIAKYQNNIIGNIGLEIFDEFVLIRSLCVEEAYRKEGIGISLYENILTYAQSKGIKELYLLTTTAESFFSHLGFEIVDRSIVPEAIRMSSEFKELCPSSAVCMKIVLKNVI